MSCCASEKDKKAVETQKPETKGPEKGCGCGCMEKAK